MKGVFFNLDFNKIEQAKDLSLVTYREDWKIPKIENPHQVRVKTLLGGICGSDLHQIFLEVSYFSSILASDINPSPLGHEFLGIIAEVGPSVENLKKGDRVIMNPISHCDSRGLDLCSSCKNGNWSQCINLSDNGWVMGGLWAVIHSIWLRMKM